MRRRLPAVTPSGAADTLIGLVSRVVRRLGWQPRVLAYSGYAVGGAARVFARVLLLPPAPAGSPEPRVVAARRGWRSFVTVPVPAQEVVVEVDGTSATVTTDRGGYVDTVVPLEQPLPPGRHWARLRLASHTGTAAVFAYDPRETTGVVSDIDDTVMVTFLPRPLLAAWNTFVLREHARRAVPGMARLLNELAHRPGIPVVYLSTGAWNVAPFLGRFLKQRGFPDGPLLLTDWGPTTTGWFRSGRAHKTAALHRLSSELPDVRWVLVGDDGQHDPEIYGRFAGEHTDHVRAVAIRQLTPAQQVLAHGDPSPHSAPEPAPRPVSVPWVSAPDGDGLLRALMDAGVVSSAS